MEDKYLDFGIRLQEFIDRRGYTQKWVGEQLGLSKNTLSAWCTGKSHPESEERVEKLADLLNLALSERIELLELAGYDLRSQQLQDHIFTSEKADESPESQLIEQRSQLASSAEVAQDIKDIKAGISISIDQNDDFDNKLATILESVDSLLNTSSKHKATLQEPIFFDVPRPSDHLFVGRDKMVTTLVQNLMSGAMSALWLEGMGGVGKSTLAVALASNQKVLNHFKDGVLWASLGPQSTGELSLLKWGEALGIELASIPEVRRASKIKDFIGQRRYLLIIDDVWNVDAARLLQCGGPNCCHLITTRDRSIPRDLRVSTDRVITIPELEEDIAWQLIEALAPEACRIDHKAVRRLIQDVGGLPLAVELLGGYLGKLEHSVFPDVSLEALQEMMNPKQRLQLATRRLGSLDNKELSLATIIALSLEDLPERVRNIFYFCGSFAPKPAAFDREAAQIVASADNTALAILISCNLIQKLGDDKLTLHRLVADVARDAAHIEQYTEATERHREYFLAIVNKDRENWQAIESIYEQVKWAWEAAPDDDRLLSFQWALNTYQERRGFLEDKIAWVQRLLELARSQEWIQAQGTLLTHLGNCYFLQGHYEKACRIYESSLEIQRILGDNTGESHALANLASVYRSLGRWDDAIGMYLTSLDIQKMQGDSADEARTLTNLGNIYRDQGRWSDAIQMYQNSLDIKWKLGDLRSISATLQSLTQLYNKLGQWGVARQLCEHNLHVAQELGDRQGEGYILLALGDIYEQQEWLSEALAMYRQSLHIAEEIDYRQGVAAALGSLGDGLLKLGQWDTALTTLQESLQLNIEMHSLHSAAANLQSLGKLFANQKKWDTAHLCYRNSLKIVRELGDRQGESNVLTSLGNLYDDQGRLRDACQMYEDSLQIKRELSDRNGESSVLNNLGRLYIKYEKWDIAIQLYEESLCISRELGDKHGEGDILVNLGIVNLHRGDSQKTMLLWQEALTKLQPSSSTYEWVSSTSHLLKNRVFCILIAFYLWCRRKVVLFQTRSNRLYLTVLW